MKELNNIEIGFIADMLDIRLMANKSFLDTGWKDALKKETLNISELEHSMNETHEENKILKSIFAKLEG